MRKYFIHDGKKQLGPFTPVELIEMGITKCTPVFTSGLGRYVTASEIPALNDAFENGNLEAGKCFPDQVTANKSKPLLKTMAWVAGVLLIILIPIIIYKSQIDVADAPLNNNAVVVAAKGNEQKLKSTLAQKEAGNPLDYLTVHGKMHRNLIGKKIIRGSITNYAAVSSYKSMEMAITFLSGNQTDLQTQRFYVNDAVAPNSAISFRNVFNAPAETAGFRIQVISAIPLP